MMNTNELREYSDEDLRAELKRRDDIKNSEWPKKFVITASIDVEDNEAFTKFLDEQCGFHGESPEYNRAINVLYDTCFGIEIARDGRVNITTIDGRPIRDLENEVSQSEPAES